MPDNILRCVVCKQEVDPKLSGSAKQVVGWIINRAQGGANYVKKAVPTGKWAHSYCLDERVMDTNQMSLEDFLPEMKEGT